MRLKAAHAVLIAATVLLAGPADGQAFNLSTMKCKDFIELPKDTISTLTVWLDGYYTDEDAAAVFEPDKLKSKADKLSAYCALSPNLGLMTAAEGVMTK
jgi:acid stress chaperone HdeB